LNETPGDIAIDGIPYTSFELFIINDGNTSVVSAPALPKWAGYCCSRYIFYSTCVSEFLVYAFIF
jgi:hypothetical protein